MPDILTTADVAAMTARAEAATPGPWRWGQGKPEVLLERGILDANGDAVLVYCGRGSGEPTDEDYELMLHARTDLPLLAVSHEALRARVADLERALRYAATCSTLEMVRDTARGMGVGE